MTIQEINLGKIQPLWRGEFTPTPVSSYKPLDNLGYLDTVYICIQEADGTQLPTDTAYFKPLIDLTTYKLQSVISFVTSQYANGDESKVALITAGLPLASYEYFVYSDLRVYSKNGATGTFSNPLDFDPDTGIDSGVTGTLTQFSAITESRVTTIESQVTTIESDITELSTANNDRTKTALNASGLAPIYACRAWVNFNGTGVVAIRASGNVSSITDNGVGLYVVNFLTPMQDDSFCFVGTHNGAQQSCNPNPLSFSTSSVSFVTSGAAGAGAGVSFANFDPSLVSVSIFR